MEEVNEAMNLLSEQEAARRCGGSRITLLRPEKSDSIALEPASCFLALRLTSFSPVSKKARKPVQFPRQPGCNRHDRFSLLNTADPYASTAGDGSTRV